MGALDDALSLVRSSKVRDRKEGLKQVADIVLKPEELKRLDRAVLQDATGGLDHQLSWDDLFKQLLKALKEEIAHQAGQKTGVKSAETSNILRRVVTRASQGALLRAHRLWVCGPKILKHCRELLQKGEDEGDWRRSAYAAVCSDYADVVRRVLEALGDCPHLVGPAHFGGLVRALARRVVAGEHGREAPLQQLAQTLEAVVRAFALDPEARDVRGLFLFFREHLAAEGRRLEETTPVELLATLNALLRAHALEYPPETHALTLALHPTVAAALAPGGVRAARLREELVQYLRAALRLEHSCYGPAREAAAEPGSGGARAAAARRRVEELGHLLLGGLGERFLPAAAAGSSTLVNARLAGRMRVTRAERPLADLAADLLHRMLAWAPAGPDPRSSAPAPAPGPSSQRAGPGPPPAKRARGPASPAELARTAPLARPGAGRRPAQVQAGFAHLAGKDAHKAVAWLIVCSHALAAYPGALAGRWPLLPGLLQAVAAFVDTPEERPSEAMAWSLVFLRRAARAAARPPPGAPPRAFGAPALWASLHRALARRLGAHAWRPHREDALAALAAAADAGLLPAPLAPAPDALLASPPFAGDAPPAPPARDPAGPARPPLAAPPTPSALRLLAALARRGELSDAPDPLRPAAATWALVRRPALPPRRRAAPRGVTGRQSAPLHGEAAGVAACLAALAGIAPYAPPAPPPGAEEGAEEAELAAEEAEAAADEAGAPEADEAAAAGALEEQLRRLSGWRALYEDPGPSPGAPALAPGPPRPAAAAAAAVHASVAAAVQERLAALAAAPEEGSAPAPEPPASQSQSQPMLTSRRAPPRAAPAPALPDARAALFYADCLARYGAAVVRAPGAGSSHDGSLAPLHAALAAALRVAAEALVRPPLEQLPRPALRTVLRLAAAVWSRLPPAAGLRPRGGADEDALSEAAGAWVAFLKRFLPPHARPSRPICPHERRLSAGAAQFDPQRQCHVCVEAGAAAAAAADDDDGFGPPASGPSAVRPPAARRGDAFDLSDDEGAPSQGPSSLHRKRPRSPAPDADGSAAEVASAEAASVEAAAAGTRLLGALLRLEARAPRWLHPSLPDAALRLLAELMRAPIGREQRVYLAGPYVGLFLAAPLAAAGSCRAGAKAAALAAVQAALDWEQGETKINPALLEGVLQVVARALRFMPHRADLPAWAAAGERAGAPCGAPAEFAAVVAAAVRILLWFSAELTLAAKAAAAAAGQGSPGADPSQAGGGGAGEGKKAGLGTALTRGVRGAFVRAVRAVVLRDEAAVETDQELVQAFLPRLNDESYAVRLEAGRAARCLFARWAGAAGIYESITDHLPPIALKAAEEGGGEGAPRAEAGREETAAAALCELLQAVDDLQAPICFRMCGLAGMRADLGPLVRGLLGAAAGRLGFEDAAALLRAHAEYLVARWAAEAPHEDLFRFPFHLLACTDVVDFLRVHLREVGSALIARGEREALETVAQHLQHHVRPARPSPGPGDSEGDPEADLKRARKYIAREAGPRGAALVLAARVQGLLSEEAARAVLEGLLPALAQEPVGRLLHRRQEEVAYHLLSFAEAEGAEPEEGPPAVPRLQPPALQAALRSLAGLFEKESPAALAPFSRPEAVHRLLLRLHADVNGPAAGPLGPRLLRRRFAAFNAYVAALGGALLAARATLRTALQISLGALRRPPLRPAACDLIEHAWRLWAQRRPQSGSAEAWANLFPPYLAPVVSALVPLAEAPGAGAGPALGAGFWRGAASRGERERAAGAERAGALLRRLFREAAGEEAVRAWAASLVPFPAGPAFAELREAYAALREGVLLADELAEFCERARQRMLAEPSARAAALAHLRAALEARPAELERLLAEARSPAADGAARDLLARALAALLPFAGRPAGAPEAAAGGEGADAEEEAARQLAAACIGELGAADPHAVAFPAGRALRGAADGGAAAGPKPPEDPLVAGRAEALRHLHGMLRDGAFALNAAAAAVLEAVLGTGAGRLALAHLPVDLQEELAPFLAPDPAQRGSARAAAAAAAAPSTPLPPLRVGGGAEAEGVWRPGAREGLAWVQRVASALLQGAVQDEALRPCAAAAEASEEFAAALFPYILWELQAQARPRPALARRPGLSGKPQGQPAAGRWHGVLTARLREGALAATCGDAAATRAALRALDFLRAKRFEAIERAGCVTVARAGSGSRGAAGAGPLQWTRDFWLAIEPFQARRLRPAAPPPQGAGARGLGGGSIELAGASSTVGEGAGGGTDGDGDGTEDEASGSDEGSSDGDGAGGGARSFADPILLEAYQAVNDPDGIYSVRRNRGDPASELARFAHEGRWADALAAYDALLRSPEAPAAGIEGLRAGLAAALRRLGLPAASGLLLDAAGAGAALDEERAEAAWRAGPHPAARFRPAGPPGFHALLCGALRAAAAADGAGLAAAVAQGRALLGGELAGAGLESTREVYPLLVRLGMLRDVEEAHAARAAGGPAAAPEEDVERLLGRWAGRAGRLGGRFDLAEPALALQAALLTALGRPEHLPAHAALVSRLARKARAPAEAAAALAALRRAAGAAEGGRGGGAAEWRLEEAKAMRGTGDLEGALAAARRLAAAAAREAAPRLEAEAALLAAKCGEESRREAPARVLAAYTRASEAARSAAADARRAAYALAHYYDGLLVSAEARLDSPETARLLAIVRERRAKQRAFELAAAAARGDKAAADTAKRQAQQTAKELAADEAELRRLRSDVRGYLEGALQGYASCLTGGGPAGAPSASRRDLRSASRLLSLWFAFGGGERAPPHALQSSAGEEGDSQGAAGAGEGSLAAVANETVGRQLPRIPAHALLPLVYQIASRLGAAPGPFSTLLADAVERLARAHPWHAIWQLVALANGNRLPQAQAGLSLFAYNQQKIEAAAAMLGRLAGAPAPAGAAGSGPPARAVAELVDLYLALAYHEPALDASGAPVPLALRKVKGWARALAAGNARYIPPCPVPTAELPVDPAGAYECAPDFFLREFEPEVRFCGGINLPKQVGARDAAGRRYRQLVKGKDDLRQDAVMEQFFGTVNAVLADAPGAAGRRLRIRTYKVIPMSPGAGIVEWVEETTPLGEWLVSSQSRGKGAHGRYRPQDMGHGEAQNRMRSLLAGDDTRPAVFREICRRFKPVMRYFFLERFPAAPDWFVARLQYTRSVAAASMVGYVVGLGDRHSQNILLDTRSAEVHIDLGVAFEQGRLLRFPETVPFRLTRDVVDGFGAAGIEGPFRRGCEETVRALRGARDELATVVAVFVHDPLYKWALNPEQLRRFQRDEGPPGPSENGAASPAASPPGAGSNAGGSGAGPGSADAERTVMRIRQKLLGVEEGEPLSVEGQVNALIAAARAPDNLCRLYAGWSPWL